MTTEPHAILVVDDDDEIRSTLLALLEDEGFKAAGARNGREALGYLRCHPRPDLIVLDLMMPVMSGQEFRAEQLRDAELAGIPVVVLSASNDGKREAEAMRVAAFFPKPVPFEQFVDALHAYVAGPNPETPPTS
jgi:CheY-like chemotaxis protein